MYRAEPTGKIKNPKRKKVLDVIPRSSVNCVIHNRYSNESVREDSTESLAYDLLSMKANEMADLYFQTVDIGMRHIANCDLVPRETIVRYFNKRICREALGMTVDFVNDIAMPNEVRNIINRYCFTNTVKGRIIAYLFCLEYAEIEMEAIGFDDEEVTQDPFNADIPEYDGTIESDSFFYFKVMIGENEKHMKIWKKGITATRN